jgi:hypothetical protein
MAPVYFHLILMPIYTAVNVPHYCTYIQSTSYDIFFKFLLLCYGVQDTRIIINY